MCFELSDYVLAGVFITKAVPRADFGGSDLLPSCMVSLSSCISNFFPDTWAIEWSSDDIERRVKSSAIFGINENTLGETIKVVTERFDTDFGWPNVIYTADAARRIFKECLPKDVEAEIIGAALHRSHVETYLKCAAPTKPEPGFAPMGAHGTCDVLSRGKSPEQPHEILGFELLTYNHGLSCSWLCNKLEVECYHKLDVSPNAHGFIGSFNDAKRCVEYVSSDEVGAEPGVWLPWLLLRYA